MHRNILLLFSTTLYYVIGTYGLYVFDAGLLTSSLVLFGIPALALSHFTLAPPSVLISVALLGSGTAILFEGIAHIYGLWYSIGITEARLFGLIPLEMLLSITVQVLFLGLLYEVLFDDGVYSPRSAWDRMASFGVFAVGALVLIGIHQYVVGGIFLSYSYFWIIGVITASSLAALALHKGLNIAFFDRVIDFTIVAAIPLAISVWISSANVHKLFGHTDEYIATFSLYGQIIPIEEIALIFALPFFVGTIYEIYLDDRL
ncbi:MAG: hypothetical protein ACI92I_000185 [Acidimicrobiales bacterium]|jgi:hypothetical protein